MTAITDLGPIHGRKSGSEDLVGGTLLGKRGISLSLRGLSKLALSKCPNRTLYQQMTPELIVAKGCDAGRRKPRPVISMRKHPPSRLGSPV
jgi:UDP-N-acetylglucosamine enolpyruvyl transferase